jgi:chromosome partitioning protein
LIVYYHFISIVIYIFYMSKVISFSQLKGGEGKTTTTHNIAFALAKKGKSVLLIDLDPQANLSSACNLTREDLKENNIYEMIKVGKLNYFQLSDKVSIIPSHLNFTLFEGEYLTKPAREFILSKLLKPIKDQFDYILIDCNPSLGLNVVNAFVVSDYIILPSKPEDFSLEGLENLLNAFYYYKNELDFKAEPLGIVITQVIEQQKLHAEKIEQIKKKFGGLVMKTQIRKNIKLAEAEDKKMDIFSYDSQSNGAIDYSNLAEEIINKIDSI